ncbi:MAG TPA: hydrogenase maturation protease [Anaerolineales bacterium]
MNILILGIGQSLRGDDAAGLEAVRLWQELCPETAQRVRLEFAELPGLGLLDLLKGMDAAVLVDAVHAMSAAGTILHLSQDDLASFAPGSGSAHGWGVAETLALGRLLSPSLAECRITLIGIVGEKFDMGTGLSQGVREVLPAACSLLDQEIRSFLRERNASSC